MNKLAKELHKAGFSRTCSLNNPCSYGVVFICKEELLSNIAGFDDPLFALIPKHFPIHYIPKNVKWMVCRDPVLEFVLVHNYFVMSGLTKVKDIKIQRGARIHESAIIGADGSKFVMLPDGSKLRLIHTGGVWIDKDVEIGPLCVVHRGSLDYTLIERGTKIGSLSAIGHNACVGKDNLLTSRVSIGGSVVSGENCWFGMGSMVSDNVTLCDNVFLGCGAVVIQSIDRPGVYVGNPARFMKDWDGETW